MTNGPTRLAGLPSKGSIEPGKNAAPIGRLISPS
jgi:hypothetical protein